MEGKGGEVVTSSRTGRCGWITSFLGRHEEVSERVELKLPSLDHHLLRNLTWSGPSNQSQHPASRAHAPGHLDSCIARDTRSVARRDQASTTLILHC